MDEDGRKLRLHAACRWGERVALVVVVVGVAVRVLGSRSESLIAILHHALPPAFLAAAACGASVLAAARNRRPRAAAWSSAMVALILWHVGAGWVPASSRESSLDVHDVGAPVRLVLWNTQHGAGGIDDVAEELRGLHADVICLIEGGGDSPEEREFWKEALPGYEAAFFGSGLIVFADGGVPGGLGASRKVDLREHGKGAVIEVGGLTLLLFDVKQGPLRSRAPVFEGLDPLLDDLADAPLVVLGDFNTPRDSPFFHRWRGRLMHAFEAAGSGYDATWPVPLPMLALDHVWASPAVEVLDCQLGWSLDSDHRPVIVQLRRRGS